MAEGTAAPKGYGDDVFPGAGRAVVVDWSGAASPARQRRSIQVAVAEHGRLLSVHGGRTRSETGDLLLELVSRRPETIVGLDFSFGFPGWFASALGATTGPDAWEIAAGFADDWLAGCPEPFWGRWGRRRPGPDGERWFRRTERSVTTVAGIRPKSTLQLGGAGSVGTGTLRGMPMLVRLRGAGCQVWPFDALSGPVMVEVWPRLATGGLCKSDPVSRTQLLATLPPGQVPERLVPMLQESEDAFDAGVCAMSLSAGDTSGGRVPPADGVDLLEGRIWPVTPIRPVRPIDL